MIHLPFISAAYLAGMLCPAAVKRCRIVAALMTWSVGAALLPTVPALAQGGAGGVPGRAAASATAGAEFTLSDATALARRQHPLLSAAGGRRRAITGAARQESAFPNPILEWRRENLGSPLDRDEFFSATIPVDVYGRRVALRTASGFAARGALADSAVTARQVEFNVARAYWRTALAVALRQSAATHSASVDTIARIEEERARQGAVPVGAALRARLEADHARLAEMTTRAEVERARGELASALALPIDSVPLPTQALLSDDALMPLAPVTSLLAAARSRRPEVQSARARVDEAMTRQLAERLGTLPAVGVQAGSKRTSGFNTGTIQVGMSLPLFDRNGGNRERAQGALQMAQGELRAQDAQLEADVISAARAYALLTDSLAGTITRAADAPGGVRSTGGLRTLDRRGRTVADIAVVAYREGAITLFELLDTERLHADVRNAAFRAAAEVQMARLDLARALGLNVDDPLPTPPAR